MSETKVYLDFRPMFSALPSALPSVCLCCRVWLALGDLQCKYQTMRTLYTCTSNLFGGCFVFFEYEQCASFQAGEAFSLSISSGRKENGCGD